MVLGGASTKHDHAALPLALVGEVPDATDVRHHVDHEAGVTVAAEEMDKVSDVSACNNCTRYYLSLLA